MRQTEVRNTIRAKELINRLQDFALEDFCEANNKQDKEEEKRTRRRWTLMTGDQVRAATSLLAKCVPDLQRTEVVGDPTQPLEFIERAAARVGSAASTGDQDAASAHYRELLGLTAQRH